MMEESSSRQNERDVTSQPFFIPLLGGFILFGIILSLLVYQFNGRTDSVQESVSRSDRLGEKKNRNRESSDEKQNDENVSPDAQQDQNIGFTVHRTSGDSYVFRFEQVLEELSPGKKVRVSLHWQNYKIDGYEKQLTVSTERRVGVELSPDGAQTTIPPGVYRLRLTGNDLLKKPLIVQRLSEYMSSRKGNAPGGTFQESPEALEYAVSIGTGKQSRQFQKYFLCELRKRGRKLIDAWTSWHRTATSAYEGEQDQIALKIFNRFMEVESAVKNVRNWIQKKEETYVILPNPSLRGELLKLSYVLSKKVNALSMTVLRQVGVSPLLWPDAYLRRGFAPNLNVKNHMEHYDRERIQEVKDAIDKSRVSSSYFDLKTYAVEQLRTLVQFVRRLNRLKTPPQINFLRFHINENEEMAQQKLISMYRYVRSIIRMHRQGLDGIINGFPDKTVRSTFRSVLDQLPGHAMRFMQQVAKKLNMDQSGMFGDTSAQKESMTSINQLIRRVSDDGKKDLRNPDCP